ncbi:nickel-type superoxide dismutase maturation protease [Streptomyces sp. AmelKG-A3]|nr:nickel-type superoxide dismutase maturation protease [Streptomyces sp. OspMP-M45]SCD57001.1 nickel-type superoxide dismutase maturation protease [Streptomyces sp. PalvLS-984]SCD88844.1 nickel-type superoxide dismutase maturation protease [Streptomyces sp. PpalLS-921]SCE01404.1 nickel-type superoxide dismutase maturation protease [Streptomyces sp. DpondAA-D4]SDD49287.1 nickel-type superoxide dismutase maturation protease [Streptomyces sp. AmelKG-A3]
MYETVHTAVYWRTDREVPRMPEELSQEPGGGRAARRPFQVVEVTGPSMVPTLYHGDWLLVQYGAPVRPGDVVILRHPFQQDLLVVKRAAERRGNGWWVLGDNAFAGGDSTDYGAVPEELVLARARARYRPLKRDQRSVLGVLRWAVSAVRSVSPDRSVSRRLRAR